MRYIFLGRVIPESSSMSINGLQFAAFSGEDRYSATVHAQGSTVTAYIETESKDLPTLRNSLEYQLGGIISAFGFTIGGAFRVEISSEVSTEPPTIFPLIFNDISAGSEIDYNFLVESIQKCPEWSDFLMRALSDYRDAILVAHNTAFYCYRAIESLTQIFHTPEMDNDRDASKKKWRKLGECLNVYESYTSGMVNRATNERHGHRPFILWEERVEIFKVAQQVIIRFVHFMRTKVALDVNEFPILK